ncbi:MAG TPA: MFS transporter [Sphingopyxis sp.]|nr:MFS transporter [Sphingopyxis sp.]
MSADASAQTRLPLGLKLYHGLGSVAYGVKDNGFSTFLLLFYNQVLGMDAKLVSLALMLALVLDAFVDPVIGYLSDQTHTRWGRRLPWLYIAPIPLAFAWFALWTPEAGATPSFWHLVGVAVIVRSLVSCCEVPSVALLPELTRDYDERTTLMRYRYLFGWAGGLLMLFLAYDLFLAKSLLAVEGYYQYGLFGGLLMAATGLISAAGQHRWAARWPDRKPSALSPVTAFREIREALTHPAFLILLAAGAIAYTSQGVTFSISNYLYLFIWKFSPVAFKIYPWVLFASVVGTFLLIGPAQRRFGKRTTAIAGGMIGMIFWVTPFVLRHLHLWPVEGSTASTAGLFVFFFLANLFSVSVMISGGSMIADIVEASEVETGRRSEGTFFAGNFFMQKCATGLGIFATGLLVDLAGIPEKADPAKVPESVIDNFSFYYCVLVILAAILSSLIFRYYPINRQDHEARVAALAATEGSGAR